MRVTIRADIIARPNLDSFAVRSWNSSGVTSGYFAEVMVKWQKQAIGIGSRQHNFYMVGTTYYLENFREVAKHNIFRWTSNIADRRIDVRRESGPIATPSTPKFVTALPGTRSGNILRRFLKAREASVDAGDVSTKEPETGPPFPQSSQFIQPSPIHPT